uniref:Arf-GAP domain-containing protein n=1 Tax=Macrostomum lignano TaxID=282301 RepID=A0A1I8FAU4_9PLAT
ARTRDGLQQNLANRPAKSGIAVQLAPNPTARTECSNSGKFLATALAFDEFWPSGRGVLLRRRVRSARRIAAKASVAPCSQLWLATRLYNRLGVADQNGTLSGGLQALQTLLKASGRRTRNDIWHPDEIGEGESAPEYEMHFRQAVSPEDMFLGTGNKTPATASCEQMVPQSSRAFLDRSAIDFASKDSQRLALEQWKGSYGRLCCRSEDITDSELFYHVTKVNETIRTSIAGAPPASSNLHAITSSLRRPAIGRQELVLSKFAYKEYRSASKLPGHKVANEVKLGTFARNFLTFVRLVTGWGFAPAKCGGPRFRVRQVRLRLCQPHYHLINKREYDFANF